MSTEVRIPTTGNAGEDAVIAEWKFAPGDAVVAGTTLLVIETAKSSVDVEAPVDGFLIARMAEVGDEIAEFAVAALIGDSADAVVASPSPTTAPQTAPGTGSAPAAPTADAPSAAVRMPAMRARGDRTAVSPRARKLAAERGVDLSTLTGSGPLGRIIIADIPASGEPATAPTAPTAAVAERATRSVAVRGARKVTAQRMQESLALSAQVTLTRYAQADRLLAWVSRLRELAATREDAPRIGVNEVVLFAVARTLARHPEANSWFSWDGITEFDAVHLGFAVDTGKALLVPVIRDADLLSVGELARAARTAIDRARSGALTADEMAGGTFTVSNLGSAGIHWFTPVLNTPQNCILGVGAAHRAVPDAPALLPLSLTFDHRALDGAAAAAVLADIASSLENVDVLTAL